MKTSVTSVATQETVPRNAAADNTKILLLPVGALWKIYSDFNKGIMLKSSISKLIKSLENTTQEIWLSEIKYLDYDTDLMPDGNTFYPLLHKQVAYSYEEEIRLIYRIADEYEHDWSKEEVEEGIYIASDINELIDQIILSPFSPKWYFNLIQDLCEKYGIKKVVNKSKLSGV